jgi:hypothetical protein
VARIASELCYFNGRKSTLPLKTYSLSPQRFQPIFEADFENCSYGFRPGRNAHQASEQIAAALKAGKTEVYDADLEGYFDSIPHDKLMKCVRMRVVNSAVAGLIKQWLEAPIVEEIREEGKRNRTPRYKVTRNNKGTPQGGVASPLLANIYLHWFDRVFYSEQGPAKWAKATMECRAFYVAQLRLHGAERGSLILSACTVLTPNGNCCVVQKNTIKSRSGPTPSHACC